MICYNMSLSDFGEFPFRFWGIVFPILGIFIIRHTHILKSREHEVQTYRLCLGILNYTKKYSKLALEDCCRLAAESNHISYSFIKNSITAVAEEIGTAGFNTKLNEERNKGAFVMSPHAGDIERLLKRSSKLAGEARDEEA